MTGRHIRGADRDRLRADAVRLYARGHSMPSVARHLGIGYGTVRQLLIEAEVEFRPRGVKARFQ